VHLFLVTIPERVEQRRDLGNAVLHHQHVPLQGIEGSLLKEVGDVWIRHERVSVGALPPAS
jgi:hypothetical protein